jgi:hypothetical protein
VAIYALSSTKIDWKTALKVFVFYDRSKGSLCIEALEGEHKGNVISSVEQLMLKDAEFRVTERSIGVVGTIEALWGAELQGDLDNDTLLGLSIGKPFRPFKGSPVCIDCMHGVRADRVRLKGADAYASRIH